VPDEAVDDVAAALVRPHAREGAALVFAHGFALRRSGPLPFPDHLDLVLAGPLGPGTLLRERYADGRGLAGLFAVVRDATGNAEAIGLAWAAAIGLTRAGVLATTLEEEVVSDLFAEQVVLVGGVVELMRAAWETLTEGGVSEEIAYYSCVQELKQILDVVHAAGPAGMRQVISGTAAYGGLTRGPRIVGEEARTAMRRTLAEIVDGDFAKEWLAERAHGGKKLAALRDAEAAHPMERAGERARRELG
jgi:ketol-acid reductoisomerase